MPQHNTFQGRFQELFQDGETQEQFAKRVGLNRNTVAAYCKGNRTTPDTEILIKLNKACNVSVDWLLGISEIHTTDPDVRKISEYTGLSEQVINELHRFITKEGFGPAPHDPQIISAMLLSREWIDIQDEIINLLTKAYERFGISEKWYNNPQDDITINAELNQNQDNMDLHIFRATRLFTTLLEKMEAVFFEIPSEKTFKGSSLEDYKSFLGSKYRRLRLKMDMEANRDGKS